MGKVYHREPKTHCIRGHELTVENIIGGQKAIDAGRRPCKACRDERRRVEVEARKVEPKPLRTHCKRGHALEGENLLIRVRDKGTERICRRCNKERAFFHYHPEADEYAPSFQPRRAVGEQRATHYGCGHAKTPDNRKVYGGRFFGCLICHRERAWFRSHPGETVYNPKGKATHCKYGHPLTPDNLRSKGAGRPECKTCHRERANQRYHENIEKMRGISREYAREHTAEARERHAEWRKANVEHCRAYARYQARRRAVGRDEISVIYVEECLIGDPCCYCGGPGEDIEHIVPVAGGGDSGWENLTRSCGPCNSKKKTQPLLRFLLRQALERDAELTIQKAI